MTTNPTPNADVTAALAPVWRDVLATSYRALDTVVAGVAPDQWQLPTPCSEWSVTQVVQHATGDQLAYAQALGIGDGPADNPFDPSGSIEGTAADVVRTAIDTTATAWDIVTDDAETVPTPLPQGALPTPVAATMCALDAAVHAWDIAVATGQPSPLTDKLATYLLSAATGLVEPLRQWGAYAPIVEPGPETATPAVDELLRYLGRTPRA